MYNHAPKDYQCPICLGIQGVESDLTLVKQSDFIHKGKNISAFINSFYIKNNKGHVIVVPNTHFEHIFDIPNETLNEIMEMVKKVSIALKKIYKCTGITLLQNNEPDGGQHAFHFHLHIFPRYKDDILFANMSDKKLLDPKERQIFAEKLKEFNLV
jgi:histidine triad (HIT) family protein